MNFLGFTFFDMFERPSMYTIKVGRYRGWKISKDLYKAMDEVMNTKYMNGKISKSEIEEILSKYSIPCHINNATEVAANHLTNINGLIEYFIDDNESNRKELIKNEHLIPN